MTKFIHWKKAKEFPFDKVVEEFKVPVHLDEAWEKIEKILADNSFRIQPHFNGSFLAFPFGEDAEDAAECWEGWEV